LKIFVFQLLFFVFVGSVTAQATEEQLLKQHVRETIHVEHLQLTSKAGDDEDSVFYGASLAWFIDDRWFWGGSAYGSALGKRGGFFIGGFRFGGHWRIASKSSIDVSVTLGGGGGGAADQGDGLFIRPEISFGYRFGSSWEVSVHAAHMRFRNSNINSPVFGCGLSYHYMRLFGATGDH